MNRGFKKRDDELEAPGLVLGFTGKFTVGVIGVLVVIVLGFLLISLTSNYSEFFGVGDREDLGGELASFGALSAGPDEIRGLFQRIENGKAIGWAVDGSSVETSIDVHFYADAPAEQGGVFVGASQANIARTDVNDLGYAGDHGFEYQVPELDNEGNSVVNRELFVHGIDVDGGPNLVINRSFIFKDCKDSDEMNFYEFGNVTNGSDPYFDACLERGKVKEWYCENEAPRDLVKQCPVECLNGACVCNITDTLIAGNYKLYNISGLNHNVTIEFINRDEVTLNVNGTLSNKLEKDSWVDFIDKRISILDINFDESTQETPNVTICINDLIIDCNEPSDCNDGITCTENICANNKCFYEVNDSLCGDGEICDLENAQGSNACLLIDTCEDADNDTIYDYDSDDCVRGLDVCPGTDKNYFIDSPSRFTSKHEPIAGDYNISEDITYKNVLDFEDFKISSDDGVIKFRENISLIRINKTGCFEPINFSSREVVFIEEDRAFLNSTYFEGFDDKSATITFYDVNFTNPRIYRDDRVCRHSCNITEYDREDFLKVRVTGFILYEVREGPYCGNDVCDKADGGETCENCAADCSCPDDCLCSGQIPGTNQTSSNQTSTTCRESWTCGAWGSCSNNRQTRTCTDGNSCGTSATRPSISQSCSPTTTTASSTGPTTATTEEEPSNVGKIILWFVIVLLILIVIAVITLLVLLYLKNKSKPVEASDGVSEEQVIDKTAAQSAVLSSPVIKQQKKQLKKQEKLIKNAKKFINQSRKKGFTDEQIKQSFRKKNWPEDLIRRIFIK